MVEAACQSLLTTTPAPRPGQGKTSNVRPVSALLAAALSLAGCATAPRPEVQIAGAPPGAGQPATVSADTNHDPFEPMNRALFSLGHGLDRAVARPIASTYRRVLPKPARRGVHNVLQNADEPGVAINDLLQGRIGVGLRTLVRFATNTTFGLAGLFDPATKAGLPHHDNGFADTLDRYGVSPGPYLYFPLLGPSSVRDAFGGVVDYVSDPVSLARYHGAATVSVSRTSLALVDTRVRLDHEITAVFSTATDPYATVRSAYRQYEATSGGEKQPPLEELPDFPTATPAAPPASGEAPPPGPPAP